MVLAFLESIKYVGHLWPIALLRLFVCTQYFRMASTHIESGFLDHPFLSEQLRIKAENTGALNIYLAFWSQVIQENWLLMSYIIVGTEVIIACSYLLGYLVRPIALWASILSLHLFWLVDSQADYTQLFVFSMHACFCLVGAGRCLGFDYYFYKSRRGLTW